MKEFRVQLFPIESGKQKLRQGEILNLKIGRSTEYGYNCVDVYYKGKLLGEIRKSGIDELIEKGAFVSAKYYDESLITITRLEHHEYRDKPEYKAWREKISGTP